MTLDFFQVFAKNSLMKDIFEEEKSLIVEHDFFLENGSQLNKAILLMHLCNVHIMNVHYAKFQKKFDSRTISGELP